MVDSEKDMADKIFQMLTTSGMDEEMIKKGREYCRGFTWERAVDETISVYENVLTEKRY